MPAKIKGVADRHLDGITFQPFQHINEVRYFDEEHRFRLAGNADAFLGILVGNTKAAPSLCRITKPRPMRSTQKANDGSTVSAERTVVIFTWSD